MLTQADFRALEPKTVADVQRNQIATKYVQVIFDTHLKQTETKQIHTVTQKSKKRIYKFNK